MNTVSLLAPLFNVVYKVHNGFVIGIPGIADHLDLGTQYVYTTPWSDDPQLVERAEEYVA